MKYSTHTIHPWPEDYAFSRGVSRTFLGAKRVWEYLRLWHTRIRARRQIAGMNIRQLEDVGLTRYDAYVEVTKPFWRF